MMAGVVRWFKSGGVALTKFTALKSRDEGEGEDDHEMEMATAPRSPQGDVDGIIILYIYTHLDLYTDLLLKMNV